MNDCCDIEKGVQICSLCVVCGLIDALVAMISIGTVMMTT